VPSADPALHNAAREADARGGDFGRIIPDLQRIITAIETEIGELERLAT
jgi:hypothetical protein